jgi:hypothetical protein
MNNVLAVGNGFIWTTSIAAGVVLCLAGYRALWAKSLPASSKSLIGEWFGYAHFHARGGDLFYKERIEISRNLLLPWRLRIVAEPFTDARETIYRGSLRCDASFIYFSMYEPVFGDQTYEIHRRIMDQDHAGNLIVGLALGKTYDDRVHCATAHVMSRKELDPAATRNHPADIEVERTRFLAIVGEYFTVVPETFQLKLF